MKKNVIVLFSITFCLIHIVSNKYIVYADNNEEYISSNIYTIDHNKKIISRVNAITDKATFLANISSDKKLDCVKFDGREIWEGSAIATGDILRVITSTEPLEYQEYTVSVVGDTIGNGQPTEDDIRIIAGYIIDKTAFLHLLPTDIELLAADFNNDGNIKMNDVMELIDFFNNIYKVSEVTLNKTVLTMIPGESEELIATINPDYADNKNVIWESSNPSVATVNRNGEVTALDKGETTITVMTEDGNKTATCQVSVHHNILLVGNSKTYRTSITNQRISMQFARLGYNSGFLNNSITSTDIKVANSDSNIFIGTSDEFTVLTKNSTTLKEKADTTLFQNYIRNKKYDIVILQEGSTTAEDIDNYRIGVQSIVNLLADFNSQLYLRTSWPRKDVTNYSEKVALMKVNTETLASEFNAIPIYDGPSFEEALNRNIEVYDIANGDYNHQNNDGAYLAAACIYATVFELDPSDITDDIYATNATIAAKLRVVAHDICYQGD